MLTNQQEGEYGDHEEAEGPDDHADLFAAWRHVLACGGNAVGELVFLEVVTLLSLHGCWGFPGLTDVAVYQIGGGLARWRELATA